jgi:hypothetical protein
LMRCILFGSTLSITMAVVVLMNKASLSVDVQHSSLEDQVGSAIDRSGVA